MVLKRLDKDRKWTSNGGGGGGIGGVVSVDISSGGSGGFFGNWDFGGYLEDDLFVRAGLSLPVEDISLVSDDRRDISGVGVATTVLPVGDTFILPTSTQQGDELSDLVIAEVQTGVSAVLNKTVGAECSIKQ